jgi:hypothetical protein
MGQVCCALRRSGGGSANMMPYDNLNLKRETKFRTEIWRESNGILARLPEPLTLHHQEY